MGTPIDKTPTGDACSVCWGIGKPFGDGDTPGIITVTLDGILKGDLWSDPDPEPPSGSFELSQIAPCQFQYNVGGLNIVVKFYSFATEVTAVFDGPLIAYSSLTNPACDLESDNDLQFPIGTEYYEGTAVILLGI